MLQQTSVLLLSVWTLGGIFRLARGPSKQKESFAALPIPQEHDVRLATSSRDQQELIRGRNSRHWLLLLLAALIDAPLLYLVYKSLVQNSEGQSRVWHRLVIAALPALLFIAYFLLSLKGEHNEEAGTSAHSDLAALHPERSAAQNLTGTWIKDGAASTSMADAIALANLNRLVRTAVKLIKGIQVLQTEEDFEFAVFSVIAWFKVREVYKMNGQPSQEKRRDLRKGKHTGSVSVVNGGHVRLSLVWDEPHGGRGYDEFRLVSSNELHVVSFLTMHGQSAGYTTVYRRKR